MTLSLQITKTGVWKLRYGKGRLSIYPTETITIVRVKNQPDKLLVDGFLIEAVKKGKAENEL